MAISPNKVFDVIKSKTKRSVTKEKAKETAEFIDEKTKEVKERAKTVKKDVEGKLRELDKMLNQSITEYNNAYTLMNDKGIRLYIERCRALDSIESVEAIVNSIANHPKSFDSDFEGINVSRKEFIDSSEFAKKELHAARVAAGGAGAGIAAGGAVAFLAPTAAMWIATTFGTASTGTAISTLTGAAATKAALAWLGGGALAIGGHGVAAGSAFLALAGPVGWTAAGLTLLSSILLFSVKRTKISRQKNEEIEDIKKNTETVKELDKKISLILEETKSIRTSLNKLSHNCFSMFEKDYSTFSEEQKAILGTLVNNTKTLSAMLSKIVE